MPQTLNHQDEAPQGGDTSLNQLDSFERCLEGWNRWADHRGPRSEGVMVTFSSGALLQLNCDGVSIGPEYFLERRQLLRELEHARSEVARLEAKLDAHVFNERAVVAAELRRLALQFRLDAADIFSDQIDSTRSEHLGSKPRPIIEHIPRPPRTYRSSTGQVWQAKGRYPRWLKEALAEGHSLSEFVV